MDSIDITDAAFSLAHTSNLIADDYMGLSSNSLLDDYYVEDYSIYMYIGVASLIFLITLFIYKFYQNKKKSDKILDCEGGFCNISDSV